MNIAEISARHDTIDMLNYPANIYAIEPIKRSMKKIVNVAHLINKIKKSQATWKDWLGLVEVCLTVVFISFIQAILIFKALVAVLDIKDRLIEIGGGSDLPIVTKVSKERHKNSLLTYRSTKWLERTFLSS
jgi:hypothetical protein